jgi:hypothetical protein
VNLSQSFPISAIAQTSDGAMVGDYFSTAFVGSGAFPVFAATLPPAQATYNEQIFVLPVGVGR